METKEDVETQKLKTTLNGGKKRCRLKKWERNKKQPDATGRMEEEEK